MPVLGLIKEGKVPSDNRVAMTPKQCSWFKKQFPNWNILVESSPTRCYSDKEYQREGIEIVSDISRADILLGIKEVPIQQLIQDPLAFKLLEGSILPGVTIEADAASGAQEMSFKPLPKGAAQKIAVS